MRLIDPHPEDGFVKRFLRKLIMECLEDVKSREPMEIIASRSPNKRDTNFFEGSTWTHKHKRGKTVWILQDLKAKWVKRDEGDKKKVKWGKDTVTFEEQPFTFPFGKHQGKPLSQVPRDYITWLHQSGSLDKEENKHIKEQLIKLGLIQ